MPQARLKGQDTQILILADGDLQARIDSIQKSDLTFLFEMLEEEYLGETAPRFDAVFMGLEIKLSGHLASRQFLDLTQSILRKVQGRGGGAVRIDISTTLIFPNGDLVNIGVPDVTFADIPVNNGGRKEFVEWELSGKSSNVEFF